jgi:hypothetical protein
VKFKKEILLFAILLGIALTGINCNEFSGKYVENNYNSKSEIISELNASSDWNPQITRTVGDYPYSVFIGDANNDGYNDIATANANSDNVSILLWNSISGGWNSQITRIVGDHPCSIFIGDVNNDGFNDIATANDFANTVSILLWNSIAGNWNPQITRSVGLHPISVFIGDANNDGYNDIAIANYMDEMVSILLWNSTAGNWNPQITRNVGDGPCSIFIGDANNDGYNDIATANGNTHTVSILLWNSTAGTWDSQITRTVGNSPKSVFIGDANNDGYNDIATANYDSDSVSLLLWNNTAGNWNPQITRTVGYSPYSVFIGDANNDGYNDIATANMNYENVNILLWNSNVGNWDSPITQNVGGASLSIFIRDANNDGFNDIATANYAADTVSLLLWKRFKLLSMDIINMTFEISEFSFEFYVYNESSKGIDFASIKMWWNGVDVSPDVQNLGNGHYFVSLEPITVAPGEDPIVLNMTISAPGYKDKYYENSITVEEEVETEIYTLCMDIIEQNYSEEGFNLTFYVYNASNVDQGIEGVIWDIFWNGTDVKGDINSIGGGYYSISLEPINVLPGDDAIRLNGTISATGFEQKEFEFYIAVEGEVETEIYTLSVNIIEQFFSEDIFNITIYIYNTSNYNQGIDADNIDIWWNGTQLSINNITSLGGGNYSLSLKPIVVQLGEHPILLQINISDSEFYEPLLFEIYILVDPELVDKTPEPGPSPPSGGGGNAKTKKAEEPAIPIITLVVVGVGSAIGASAITIFILRKRILPKRAIQKNQT